MSHLAPFTAVYTSIYPVTYIAQSNPKKVHMNLVHLAQNSNFKAEISSTNIILGRDSITDASNKNKVSLKIPATEAGVSRKQVIYCIENTTQRNKLYILLIKRDFEK